MIWLKRQSQNTNKHPLMPSEYPWCIQEIEPSDLFGWETVNTQEELDLIINSFDLSEYEASLKSEENLMRQTAQREYGVSILDELIDSLGNRNLDLIDQGIIINIIDIAKDNSSVKLLIETGALTTARDLISTLKTKYPHHSDVYENAYNKINDFLIEKDFT